jgi:hypothetical protein
MLLLRPKIKDARKSCAKTSSRFMIDDSREQLVSSLQALLRVVPTVVVAGVLTIVRAVAAREPDIAAVKAAEVVAVERTAASKLLRGWRRKRKLKSRGKLEPLRHGWRGVIKIEDPTAE